MLTERRSVITTRKPRPRVVCRWLDGVCNLTYQSRFSDSLYYKDAFIANGDTARANQSVRTRL